MKMSATEFMNAPRKAITFMGMSGVGKTHLSGLMEEWGWAHYSCDFEIGRNYLASDLSRPMTSPDDIGVLSEFIGKLGNPDQGGMPYDEFKRRQNLYYEAECQAVAALPLEIEKEQGKGRRNFVHDSTGSLCEIVDDEVLEVAGQATLFVYLRASAEEEKTVLERAQKYPKPLFFPPASLEWWGQDYVEKQGLGSVDEMDPDGFSRWVFPKLFSSRLPKYQRLADRYGVTIESADMYGVGDEADFLDRLVGALERTGQDA
jgi:hypothetical protein